MAKAVLGVGALQGVRIVASFLSSAMLARALGPEAFGLASLVLAVVLVGSLPVNAGLPTLIMREVARNEVRGGWGETRGLIHTTSTFVLISTFVIVLPTSLYAAWRATEEPAGFWGVLAVGVWICPISGLASQAAAIMRGLRMAFLANQGDLLVRPLVLVSGAAVITAFNLDNAFAAMAAQLAAYLATLIFVVALLSKKLPNNLKTAKPTYARRAWLKAALPFTMLAATIAVSNQVQMLLLGIFSTDDQNGYFATASAVAYLVSLPLITINLVVEPHLARLYQTGDLPALQMLATKVACGSFVLTLIATVVFLLVGQELVVVIYGVEYLPTFWPAVLLAMGQVVNVAAGPCGQLLNMSGNERMTTWAVAIGLLVNATFGVALVPALGAAGAAISGAIATLTWNVVMVMAVKRSLGINSSIIGNASLKLIGNGVRARARKNKARDDVTPL